MKRGLLSMLAVALCMLGVNAQTWTGNVVQAGTFYLYNVGSGLFLTGGNNWGTHASLSEAGSDFILTPSGNGYTIDSQFSNGGNSHYVAGAFIDGGPTDWFFEGDASGYTIKNSSGQALYATGEGSFVDISASATGDNAKWILVSRDDILNAMESATLENPINVSSLIKCADLSRNDTRKSYWKVERSGGNFTLNGPDGNRTTYGGELWNNTFDLYQILSGVPEGRYELRVSGYGSNGTTSIYINDVVVPFVNTTTSADFSTALNEIAAGSHGGNTTGIVVVSDPTMRIGIKRTNNSNYDWTVFDNFRLYFYGFDLASLVAAFETALEDAKKISGDMSAIASDNLSNTIGTCESVDKTSKDDVRAAMKALGEACDAANASIDTYKKIAADLATFKKNYKDGDASAMETKYSTGTYQFYEEFYDELYAAKLAALGIQDGTDYTDLIINSAPYLNNDGWTATQTPDYAEGASNHVAEYWNKSGARISQTLKNLPAGVYTLNVIALTRTGMQSKIGLNGDETIIVGVDKATANDRTMANNWFNAGNGINTVTTTLPHGGDLTIWLQSDNTTGDHWTVWRSFSLSYSTIKELLFVDAGTEKFQATKKKDGEYTDITATITGGGELAGNKDNLKDGIRIVYENTDVLNENLYTAGFKAEAEITDNEGTTYFVKAAEKDDVIKLAQGLFGPNTTYTVTLKPIVYYNFDLFLDEIYEAWETGKETHMQDKGNGKFVLDPTWTLQNCAKTWTTNFWAGYGVATDPLPINYDYCDPLPLWSNGATYTFTVKTDGTVKQDLQTLVKSNTVTAFNAWGEDITAELLGIGGTATGITGINAAANDATIFNLAGQRVAKTQKGIYVVNGKKVAVK